MTHEHLAQDTIDQIQVYDHEYGTGRVSFGAYLYLMSHVELLANSVVAMAGVVATIRDNTAAANGLLTTIRDNTAAANGLIFTSLTLLTPIRDNTAAANALLTPIRDNTAARPGTEFQFGKGTAPMNSLTKLVGVVTAKPARRGVVIRNLDEKEPLLVTTADKATAGNAPTPAQCFWVLGAGSATFAINAPDSVLVSGIAKAVEYSWHAN